MKKFCYRVEIYDKDSNMINVYYDYCCAIDIMSSHDIIRIIVKQSLSNYLNNYNSDLLKSYGSWDKMIYNNEFIINIIFIEICGIDIKVDKKIEASILCNYIINYMFNNSDYYVVLSDDGIIAIKKLVNYRHETILYDSNDSDLFKEKIYDMCLEYLEE